MSFNFSTLIDSYEVTSSVSSVVLTGMNSSFSTYQLYTVNPEFAGNFLVVVQFQVGGVTDTTTSYTQSGAVQVYDNNGYNDYNNTLRTHIRLNSANSQNVMGGNHLLIMNSQDGTEYTYCESRGNSRITSGNATANYWGSTFEKNAVISGLEISDANGNNITQGNFYLYGIR